MAVYQITNQSKFIEYQGVDSTWWNLIFGAMSCLQYQDYHSGYRISPILHKEMVSACQPIFATLNLSEALSPFQLVPFI